MEKTKLGIPANYEAAIAYSIPMFSVITGFVMLVLETENKFVRFHAMQSFILFGFYSLVGFLLNLIPFLGKPLMGILGFVTLVSWIVLIINALKGESFKFPFIGEAVYSKIMD